MNSNISAIILAAGSSSRMGQPKMLMPWGDTTILGQVVSVIGSCGISDISVITGGARELIEKEILRLGKELAVRSVFNPNHESGEMLSSLQAGLLEQQPEVEATLIGLGDQPQIHAGTVKDIITAFRQSGDKLIIPSFEKRRGHPLLIPRLFWPDILQMEAPDTLRDFINSHVDKILYVDGDASVLQDIDTPEEYRKARHT
jgi:molybdenum cofactor cytidylyltransferase